MLVHSESFSNPPRSICLLVSPDFVSPFPGNPPPHRDLLQPSMFPFSYVLQFGELCKKKKVTSLFYRRDLSRKKYHIWNGDKILRILIPHMKEIEGLRSKKLIIDGLKLRYNARSFKKKFLGVKIDDLITTVNLLKHRDRGCDQNFRFFEKRRPITPSDRR